MEKRKELRVEKRDFENLKQSFSLEKKNCYMFKTPHTIWSFKELNSLYVKNGFKVYVCVDGKSKAIFIDYFI